MWQFYSVMSQLSSFQHSLMLCIEDVDVLVVDVSIVDELFRE